MTNVAVTLPVTLPNYSSSTILKFGLSQKSESKDELPDGGCCAGGDVMADMLNFNPKILL